MKIGIIGATGHIGQGIANEALNRGHEVTAIVRNAAKAKDIFGDKVTVLAKDALTLTKDDLAGLDVVVNAFSTRTPYLHLDLAAHLLGLLRENKSTRVLFVIGSSTLQKADGTTLLADTLKQYAGEPWIDAPIQQDHEFNFIKWVNNVDWSIITPSIDFTDGPKTSYKLGTDQVIASAAGKQVVSVANFAAAALDEIENPKHNQQRFDVADA